MKKQSRKLSEFWSFLSMGSGHTAEQTEKLFKNLSSEYQKVRQSLHRSGLGTDNEPALRNSHDLYLLFEQYFALYFPQGGSTVPPFVMTEKSVTLFSEMAATEFLANVSGTDCSQTPLNGSALNISHTASSPQPTTSTSQPQPSTSASRPLALSSIPPARQPNFQRKRKSAPATDLLSSMVKLQTRQLQLERERNRIEREKLQCLTAIQGELTAIRATLCHSVGVTFMPVQEE